MHLEYTSSRLRLLVNAGKKYEHLFDISIIINLCAIFLQITFSLCRLCFGVRICLCTGLWIVAYKVSVRMPQGVKCSVQCLTLFKNSIINHRNGKKYTLTMAMATTVEWQVMVMVLPSRGIFILIFIFILFHAHHLPTMKPSRYALGFAVNGSNNRVLVSCNLTNPLFSWSSSSHSFVTVCHSCFVFERNRILRLCLSASVCVRINSKLAIKTKNVIKLPSLITFIHHITFYQ